MRSALRWTGLKDSKQAVAGEALTSLSGFAPPVLLALGARWPAERQQRNINTVTTNVPGPQIPLYVVGRRMLKAYPYVPLGRTDPGRRRHLLLRRPGQLRRDRRLRHGTRHRRPLPGIEEGLQQLLKLST